MKPCGALTCGNASRVIVGDGAAAPAGGVGLAVTGVTEGVTEGCRTITTSINAAAKAAAPARTTLDRVEVSKKSSYARARQHRDNPASGLRQRARSAAPRCVRSPMSSYHPGMSPFRLWAIGVVLGVAAALVVPYTFSYYGVPFLVAIGLALTAALLRPRPAGSAGYLTAVGALWLLTLQRTTEQCAELNRQPNASCQMGDNSLLVLVGLLLLGAGLALTALLFVSRRPSIPAQTPL
jgi:hypothetical protein